VLESRVSFSFNAMIYGRGKLWAVAEYVTGPQIGLDRTKLRKLKFIVPELI
jgi:hypothetical protein